jgi:hypothetical protein
VALRRRPATDLPPATGDDMTAEPADSESESPAVTAGKGRPTPKRVDARTRRRAVAPKNRKEAVALQRERARTQRRKQRQALVTGDETNLPPRDAGPEKRLARDVVDSRFTYGQVFFGLVVLVLLLSFVPNQQVGFVVQVVALVSVAGMGVDGYRVGRRAQRAVVEQFGPAAGTGITSYALLRALLPRRLRRPPPRPGVTR